ncbi:GNAT family N-acetyltransferase [Pseudoduganella sp. DS3]|uniref:GNAT family N-acetyltransferase n=1 Tax=Pseudoduganella guangdongensis TaxID=2692179 RepID=A0A6N9HJD3_9BURK|nr:GNAT family N-acetyltransferase [Pseudoduganella guangdongensis]MYN03600.1 GNAT family N-acetyltransferase [Pseudoduganella guangdongensis]
MKIARISEQDAAALDRLENTFTCNEVLDISFTDGEFRLDVRSVTPFSKSYDADDSLDEDVEAYGAYMDGTLVGKIELTATWNGLASIEHIVVARSQRKSGVATGLINFAKEWAASKQLKGIRLETQTHNVPACRLYLRNGFKVGGMDSFVYRTQPEVAHETALYMYWIPE